MKDYQLFCTTADWWYVEVGVDRGLRFEFCFLFVLLMLKVMLCILLHFLTWCCKLVPIQLTGCYWERCESKVTVFCWVWC